MQAISVLSFGASCPKRKTVWSPPASPSLFGGQRTHIAAPKSLAWYTCQWGSPHCEYASCFCSSSWCSLNFRQLAGPFDRDCWQSDREPLRTLPKKSCRLGSRRTHFFRQRLKTVGFLQQSLHLRISMNPLLSILSKLFLNSSLLNTFKPIAFTRCCLLYTSDAADE